MTKYNFRIDWIDRSSGAPCLDLLTREAAIWEAKNDLLGEIISITEVTWIDDDTCVESENLLEIFKNL